MINQETLNTLVNAEKTDKKTAYLKKVGQDTILYCFLYNPSEYSDSYSANYSETSAITASTPYLDYSHTSGITREIPDLLIDTFEDRRSFRSVIEGLKSWMIAAVGDGEYEPPDLEFVMGSEVLKPVKLVDFKYRITDFLGGEPAKGVFSLTLREVPIFDPARNDTIPKSEITQTDTETITESAKNSQRLLNADYPDRISLTDRQIESGIKKVQEYLVSNLNKYSSRTKRLIQSKKYRISITVGGSVTLYSTVSDYSEKLGTYSGVNFRSIV